MAEPGTTPGSMSLCVNTKDQCHSLGRKIDMLAVNKREDSLCISFGSFWTGEKRWVTVMRSSLGGHGPLWQGRQAASQDFPVLGCAQHSLAFWDVCQGVSCLQTVTHTGCLLTSSPECWMLSQSSSNRATQTKPCNLDQFIWTLAHTYDVSHGWTRHIGQRYLSKHKKMWGLWSLIFQLSQSLMILCCCTYYLFCMCKSHRIMNFLYWDFDLLLLEYCSFFSLAFAYYPLSHKPFASAVINKPLLLLLK